MSTGYGWEVIKQVCATLLGARHVPERLCGGPCLQRGAITSVWLLPLPFGLAWWLSAALLHLSSKQSEHLRWQPDLGSLRMRNFDQYHQLWWWWWWWWQWWMDKDWKGLKVPTFTYQQLRGNPNNSSLQFKVAYLSALAVGGKVQLVAIHWLIFDPQ